MKQIYQIITVTTSVTMILVAIACSNSVEPISSSDGSDNDVDDISFNTTINLQNNAVSLTVSTVSTPNIYERMTAKSGAFITRPIVFNVANTDEYAVVMHIDDDNKISIQAVDRNGLQTDLLSSIDDGFFYADNALDCGVGYDQACKLYHQLGVIAPDEYTLHLFFTHGSGVTKIDVSNGIDHARVKDFQSSPLVPFHQLLVHDDTVYATSLVSETLTMYTLDIANESFGKPIELTGETVKFSPTKPQVVMGDSTVYFPFNSGYTEYSIEGGSAHWNPVEDNRYFVSKLSYKNDGITSTEVLKQSSSPSFQGQFPYEISLSNDAYYQPPDIYTNFYYPRVSILGDMALPGVARVAANTGQACLIYVGVRCAFDIDIDSDHDAFYKTSMDQTYHQIKSPTHFVYDFDHHVLVTIAGYGHIDYMDAFNPDEVIIVSTGFDTNNRIHRYADISNNKVRVTHVVPGSNSVWMVGHVVSEGGNDGNGALQYTEKKAGYVLLQAIF